MEENVDLKVVVQVQEAERNLENLNNTLDETKDKVDDINDSVDSGIPTVGGLDKAFESVFNTVSKEGSKGGAIIKKIFDSVKNAIPTVKALNNTAITGLKGIKGAIAATGLGILVVLLGELIAHWDQFSAAIQKWIPFMRQGHEETEKLTQANEDLLTVNKEQNDEINFQVRLMKALGAEEKDVINYKIKETQALQSNTEAQIRETEAKIASMKAHSAFRRWITGENKDIEKLEESLKALTAENERLTKSIKSFNQDLIIEDAKSQTERTKAAKKGSKERTQTAKVEVKDILEAYKKATEQGKALLNNLINREQLTSYYQLLTGLPEASAKAIGDRVQAISLEFAKDRAALEDAIQGEKTLVEELRKAGTLTPEEEKASLSRQKDYFNALKAITLQYTEEAEEVVSQAQTESIQRAKDYAEELSQLAYELEVSRVSTGRMPEEERNAKLYELEQQRLKDHKKYLEDLLAMEEVGTEEYQNLQLAIAEANNAISISENRRTQQRRAEIESEIRDWTSAAQSIADIFGTIAEIEESRLNRLVESGKITQEEAEKQFETAKAWQYAETWINTIAGMTAALTSPVMQSMGIPGWIAAAAQAATLLASGIAQTVKIKNTKFGGGAPGGGGGGVSAPNVGVTPIDVRDDIQVSPTTLAQSQSPADQRVYILEGDIQDSNKRVEIREANSTF